MKGLRSGRYLTFIAAILALLAPLTIWPYAYFQILRWVVTLVAVYNALNAWQHNRPQWTIVMAGLAILFNPIAPIFLSKETWTVLDLAAGAILLVTARILYPHKG